MTAECKSFFFNPVRVVRAGLDELARYVVGHNVLLVTSPGFTSRGITNRVRSILVSKKLVVWDEVKPNPNLYDLDAASVLLSKKGIECVIGMGGGSAIDAAKVLATTLASPLSPSLAQVFRNKSTARWNQRLPLIAIPTTAGTGAEVTPFATIWDHIEHKKYSLAGDFVFPDTALLDSSLALTLGTKDTLFPALDTISHALESLWNKNCTPISRAFAFRALDLSNSALPIILGDPTNTQARADLQLSSVLAGMAISQTRTAIAHAISYPLTSTYGVPHGLACSFTLPALLKLNLGDLKNSKEEETALKKTLALLQKQNLTARLSEFVKLDDLKGLVENMGNIDRLENYKSKKNLSLISILKLAIENH